MGFGHTPFVALVVATLALSPRAPAGAQPANDVCPASPPLGDPCVICVAERAGPFCLTCWCTDAAAALPNPAAPASKKARRLAAKLTKKLRTGSGALSRAFDALDNGACGTERTLLKKAQKNLRSLLTAAQAGSAKGTLGVPLAPIEAAVDRLLNLPGEYIEPLPCGP